MLHLPSIYVGKYTSPKDPMGNVQVDLAQKIRVPIAALPKSTLFLAWFCRGIFRLAVT